MSHHDSTDAFRSSLSGVHRSNTNPRPHAIAKPYSRPDSNASPAKEQNGGPSGPAGYRGLVKSHSSSTLNRSGSEPGLFSGLRSMLTRPLAWLTTPSRQTTAPATRAGTTGRKRDNFASFGGDADDDDAPSPSAMREGKRARQVSPPHQRGPYEPDHMSITGRAVTGKMLPPLSPGMSLSAKRNPSLHRDTNFSRPLAYSKSMPYLDPPSSALSPSRRGLAKGPLTRSRRTDLHGLAGDDAEAAQPVPDLPNPDSWSPWKDRYRNSMTPRAQTPGRSIERDVSFLPDGGSHADRQFALPSLSPFKAPPHASGSLVRSATLGSQLRRASSIATDVSMGGAESPRLQRRSLYSALPEAQEADDNMGVDGERQDGSIVDWVMRDRWSGVPGSPASVAASRRLGSVTPSVVGAPPIRKGQLVWAGEKGFVRESELETPEPSKPAPRNEAEAILYALESSRNTPVAAARASTSSLPPSLIGSSSREIRKAINVPMATAQAGETARKRRERERLGEDHNVMISPYGRRQQVDRAVREVQRARSTSAMEEDRRMSRSPSAVPTISSDAGQVSASDREESTTPAPAPPRRSSRLKRASSPLPEDTPQPHRRSRKTSAGLKDANIESSTPRATPSRRRRSTQDRHVSPPPAVPAFPTIIETAASPEQKSTYQPRADGELAKGQSSLRAKTEINKRKHEPSASYGNSREASPAGGRYSAKEEDLPDMDELESQPKISLGPFSGPFDFTAPPAGASTSTQQKSAAPQQSSTSNSKSTLAAPSNSGRPGAGPLSRLNASRPRAPSPLASGTSIVPAPSSPETAKAVSPEPAALENGFGFFPMSAGNSGTTTPATKSAPFGTVPFGGPAKDKEEGRPTKRRAPADDEPTEDADADTNGEIPDFFKKSLASVPSSGAASPATTFNFGTGPKSPPTQPVRPAASSAGFTFGTPSSSTAGSTSGGFNFGASKPADTTSTAPSFSVRLFPLALSVELTVQFGKQDDQPKKASAPSFSFGSADASTGSADISKKRKTTFAFGETESPSREDEPAASSASTSGFAFGSPAPKPAEKPTDPAKPTFNFGSPATTPSVSVPTGATKPSFSFGAPSKPDEAKSTSSSTPFQFGAPPKSAGTDEPKKDADKPAATFSFGGSAPKPAGDQPKTGFSFGAATKPAEEPKTASFSFGTPSKPAEEPKAAPTAGFSFGASSSAKPAETPKSPSQPDKPTFNFGAPASAADTPKPTFNFGASSSSTETPKADTASKPTFSFGSTPASSTPSSGFTFGAAAKPKSPPPGATNPFGSSGSSTAPTTAFNFGSSAQTSAPFGASTTASNSTFTAPSTDAAPSNPFASPPPTSSAANPFSSTTSPAAAPAPGGFNFGQPASSTPATNGSSAPFTFGATAAAPSTDPPPYSPMTGGFGGASTAPATTPSFTFGAPAASANGGFGASNGFGPSTTTSNAFGTSTTPAANNNTGGFNFSFGATTPGATSAPSTPFVFAPTGGTPAAAPSANPFGAASSTPNATFSFGQSASTPNANPTATGFSFGSSTPSAPIRFDSPAPEGSGGFSMGTASDPLPGSPGARQIKPLRKPRR